jgi:hypothetical protein
VCFHVEPFLSTLPRSRLCVLQLKLLLAAAAPLSRHRCDGHHSCARRPSRFQRWLRLATQLNCHRDHIRPVHPHATTKGIQHFPTPVPILSAVHIVPENIAQVDMVQGLHLRNTLIPRKGAISRTRPIKDSVFRVRKRTPVRGTVHQVLAQRTGLVLLLSDRPQ